MESVRKPNADQRHRLDRPARHLAADRERRPRRGGGAHDHVEAEERARRQIVIAVGDARIAPVPGEQELRQVVAADRQEIEPPAQGSAAARPGRGPRAWRPALSSPGSVTPRARARSISSRRMAAAAAVRRPGDHREHDIQPAPVGGQDQGAQLLAQHRGRSSADADRPPAHRRVFLLGAGPDRATACRTPTSRVRKTTGLSPAWSRIRR